MKQFFIQIRISIILSLFVMLLMSFGQCSVDVDKNVEEFQDLLERANLLFFEPENYTIVPIIPNKQVAYHTAFRLDNGIEMRYLIWPYDNYIKEYNEYLERKEKGIKRIDPERGEVKSEVMANPNNMYSAFFLACLFNICEKTDSSWEQAKSLMGEYKEDAVKKEFNGDFGMYSGCNTDPEFAQDFKYCSVYLVHKEDYGMFLCFILYRDKEHMSKYYKSEELTKAFYSVQFYLAKPPAIPHPKGVNRIIGYEYYKGK